MRISQRLRKGRLFRSALLAIALALLCASTAYLAHLHNDADVTARHGAVICDLCAQLGTADAPPAVVAFEAPPVPFVERTVTFVLQTLPVRRVVATRLPRGPPVG
jgi:hypothetical protein